MPQHLVVGLLEKDRLFFFVEIFRAIPDLGLNTCSRFDAQGIRGVEGDQCVVGIHGPDHVTGILDQRIEVGPRARQLPLGNDGIGNVADDRPDRHDLSVFPAAIGTDRTDDRISIPRMQLRDEAFHRLSLDEPLELVLEFFPIGGTEQGVHVLALYGGFFVPERGRPRTIDVSQRSPGIGDLNEVVRVVEEVAKPVFGLRTNLHLTSHREIGLAYGFQCRGL